ncbi:MAG TPA: DUF3667 domain-containing protein [Pyrinomonadaceae bacterium]
MAAQPETVEAPPPPPPLTRPEEGKCLNCGAGLLGEFCHVCGQKKAHAHELGVRHFFGHLLHEITHLDSNKIARTLKALLFQPGLLTEEYLAGRKGRHINPIRVYLTISALFFIVGWATLIDSGGSGRAPNAPPSAPAATQAQPPPPQGAEARYAKTAQKREKLAALLRFASVLVSGLFLTALFYRSGRFYVEHLIFSLHFYSFDFILRSALALLYMGYNAAGLGLHLPTRVAFYLVLFVYLYLALHRVYRQGRALTLVKAFVLLACEVALFTLIVFGAAFAAMALT